MRITERYPEQKKRRRHLWMTRRLTHGEVYHLLFPQVRQLFPVVEDRPATNRCFGEVNTPKMSRDFYRFSTKPNWAGVAAAQKGANQCFTERERGR